MAAISVTAASVRGLGTTKDGIAGATITAGLALYLDTSGLLQIAVNDTAPHAAVVGISLNGGSANQPIKYQIAGQINPGGTVAVGKQYCLGTAGGIIPVDDIAGSEFITAIGVGISATIIQMALNISGVAAAGSVS